ncbi:MAG: VOC family protein [Terracidiphilus sp.]
MTNQANLGERNIVAFVPIVDAATARSFYGAVLGLKLIEQELPFAVVFDAHGTTLRLTLVGEFAPAPWTVLGWDVPDLEAAVCRLESAGVRFERYEWMKQDEQGIWSSPSGAKVAWFKDPDGNVLSLSQVEGQ